MSDEVIRVEKVDSRAKLPTRATPGSAGLDLYSAECVVLLPGEFKVVSTGIKLAVAPGYEVQVRPRSGLAAKYGVTVLNAPGTIDSDYRGEVKVILINHGKEDFVAYEGDRIAQLVIGVVTPLEVQEVESLEDTSRGSGGFGSTGA